MINFILLGLLNGLFEILYDNDVITTDAFETWKKDAEKKAGYGKF
jgi:hypothetical protein